MTAEADVKRPEEELQVELVPEEALEYPGGQGVDEQRRAYIISQMANADIDGAILVSNMDRVYRWLKGEEQEVACSTTLRQLARS